MTEERVPTWLLEAGDVIRVHHQHDCQVCQCLTHWQADAVVTEAPARVGRRVVIKWAGDTRLPGSSPAVTGISVVRPGEQALRIGRLPGRSTRRRGQALPGRSCPPSPSA
jgi:hypothetical protein